MKLRDALRRAERRLAVVGVPDPGLDAERLLRHVLAWDRASLLARERELLAPSVLTPFEALVEERAQRRPLQHLIGTQAFWRHEFRVTPDVLIPRPETELLVEAAIEAARAIERPRIVDVGTGSGCIALSLAAELAGAEVHAVDVSESALSVARKNAARLNLERGVRFHLGDLLEPAERWPLPLDVIVSNPPYVAAQEFERLMPEVRDHEPQLALVPPGEADSVYRRLVPQAAARLAPGGWLILEVGRGMADAIADLCGAAQLPVRRRVRDLQGIDRALVARRAELPQPTL